MIEELDSQNKTLEILHYQNKDYELRFEPLISESLDQVRELLPNLPEDIKIYFSNYGILEHTGVGGYAYSKDIITISLDPNFDDIEKQKAAIRPAIFHEAFHLSQGFTGDGGPFSAIDNALYEGMATVFEREHANALPPYGDYSQLSEETLQKWTEELTQLNAEDFADEKVQAKWKFYHPELEERWIAYKTGAWLVDQVLKKNELTILDLSTKKATEVLGMYNQ